MLLLLVRSAMKIRTRDYLLGRAGQKYMNDSALVEFRWLLERVDEVGLARLAEDLLGSRAACVVGEIVAGPGPTLRQLRALRSTAQPSWGEFRMYPAWHAAVRRWLREARARASIAMRRVGRAKLRSCARTAPQGGLLVALVGPDGAGKSTLVRELTRWLSREADVVALYGGSGSGPVSLPRLALQKVGNVVRFRSQRGAHGRSSTSANRAADAEPARQRAGVRAVAYALWALSLARERRRNVRRARRARDRGKVVIADRFPQTQFSGLNDGPKLEAWRQHQVRLFRWASALERSAYRSVDLSPPDLVVKLQLPADVALERKPDTPPDRLRRKVEVVALLRYPPTTRVAEVDAAQPLERVVLRVKHAVWECL
jgi:thymidylate kinase